MQSFSTVLYSLMYRVGILVCLLLGLLSLSTSEVISAGDVLPSDTITNIHCGIYSTCVNHHLYSLLFSFQFFDYVTCHCSNYTQTIDVYDGANCMNASRVVSYELVFSLFNYSHSSFTYRFDHGSFLYHLNSTDCKYDIGISYPLSTDCIPYDDLRNYFDSMLLDRNFSASVSYMTTTLTYRSEYISELKMDLISEEGCSSSWITNLILIIVFCIFFCIILSIMIYYLIQHLKSSTEWIKRQVIPIRQKPVKYISSPIPLNRNPYTINM
ncbi:hypothetical protein WA171_005383, partial [Blastocystis sp. BT1]